jgi:hypothetical protein
MTCEAWTRYTAGSAARERAGEGLTRERKGRRDGRNKGEADSRPGEADVVRTPPPAAVCPVAGLRRRPRTAAARRRDRGRPG